MNPLNVEYRKVETLIPYARNPRTHNDAQIAKIAASIVEYGWTNPILVDGGNGIIAGHGRLAAARKLELADVPVIELAHLTPAQKRAYVIADNRLALDAGWDEEMLALELAELSGDGFDLALTGLDATELQSLLADTSDTEARDDDESDDADEVPDVPATPVSRTGDVWAIGAHRLICGDAADADVISTLMAGERAAGRTRRGGGPASVPDQRWRHRLGTRRRGAAGRWGTPGAGPSRAAWTVAAGGVPARRPGRADRPSPLRSISWGLIDAARTALACLWGRPFRPPPQADTPEPPA